MVAIIDIHATKDLRFDKLLKKVTEEDKEQTELTLQQSRTKLLVWRIIKSSFFSFKDDWSHISTLGEHNLDFALESNGWIILEEYWDKEKSWVPMARDYCSAIL